MFFGGGGGVGIQMSGSPDKNYEGATWPSGKRVWVGGVPHLRAGEILHLELKNQFHCIPKAPWPGGGGGGHFHWKLYHIRMKKNNTEKGVGAEREKGVKIMQILRKLKGI